MHFKEFLIDLVVSSFNNQFNRDYCVEDFDAYSVIDDKSLLTEQEPRCIYELSSVLPDDIFKIRVYCKNDTYTDVGEFKTKESSNIPVFFGDELFVADARIDLRPFRDISSGISNACPKVVSVVTDNLLLYEDMSPILLETGEAIALE
jgi:hypothetical protein